MDLYLKSILPEKSYFKAMAGCIIRGYINTANKILNDKININNIDLAISEYEDFYKPKNYDKFDINSHLNENSKMIYEKLLKIKKAVIIN
jgi:hypothetical protein